MAVGVAVVLIVARRNIRHQRWGGSLSVFNPEVNQDNRDPRVACALVLDTSSSMSGAPIAQLNAGYETFRQSIDDDELARKRTEMMVITFADAAPKITVPWTEGRHLGPETFASAGVTPLGAALNLALDQVNARKQTYKEAGLEYYQPWIFVITDGEPTDPQEFQVATARLREAEAKKAVTVFGVGVADADMATLAKISGKRDPVKLDGLKFKELFIWLSQSMSLVANSKDFGSSDKPSGNSDEQIYDAQPVDEMQELPAPNGWATW